MAVSVVINCGEAHFPDYYERTQSRKDTAAYCITKRILSLKYGILQNKLANLLEFIILECELNVAT